MAVSRRDTAVTVQQDYFNQLETLNGFKFTEDDYEYLRIRIACLLYGHPNSDIPIDVDSRILYHWFINKFTSRQVKRTNEIYTKIIDQTKYLLDPSDGVLVFFVLVVCCTPKHGNNYYNIHNKPISEINCTTTIVFRIRKCIRQNGELGCCVYVDSEGRVYQSWNEYLLNNKLHKCYMVVPRNGFYRTDEGSSEVLLSVLESPALRPEQQLLSAADTTSTTLSVASIVPMVLSLATPVAPAVLTAAVVTGLSTGIYSAVRSAFHLHDRRTHEQSISLMDSEARGSYLTIGACVISAASSGSSKLLGKMASTGSNATRLGKAVKSTVDVTRYANLVVSGGGVGNSIVTLIYKAKEGEEVKTIEIVQCAASIFFFANAIVSQKTAESIIRESQEGTLQKIRESMGKRSRKLLNRAQRAATSEKGPIIANTEIIQGVVKVQNTRQFFKDVIQRSNSSKTLTVPGDSRGNVLLNSNVSARGVTIGKAACEIALIVIKSDTTMKIGKFAIKFSQEGIDALDQFLCEFVESARVKIVQVFLNLLGNLPEECMRMMRSLAPDNTIIQFLVEIIRAFFNKSVAEFVETFLVNDVIVEERVKKFMIILKNFLDTKVRRCGKREILCMDCGGFYYK